MTTQIQDRIAQLEAENARLDMMIRDSSARVPAQEAEEVSEERRVAKIRPTYGYYRQPDGWITASPMTDMDELKYRRGGWEPLTRYGYFEMSTDWAANHPLEALFMRGGARELSEDQIIQQGLYMDPPLVPTCRQPLNQDHKRHVYECMANAKPVVFPQLKHRTDLGPFACTFGCGREFPTTAARDQHASVMHAPEKSDERTGESLATALTKGLSGVLAASPSVVEPTVMPLDAIMTQLAALQRELAALKAEAVAVPSAVSGQSDETAVTQKKSRYRPDQAKHTHKGPYGRAWLVAGCPRCEELERGE